MSELRCCDWNFRHDSADLISATELSDRAVTRQLMTELMTEFNDGFVRAVCSLSR